MLFALYRISCQCKNEDGSTNFQKKNIYNRKIKEYARIDRSGPNSIILDIEGRSIT